MSKESKATCWSIDETYILLNGVYVTVDILHFLPEKATIANAIARNKKRLKQKIVKQRKRVSLIRAC